MSAFSLHPEFTFLPEVERRIDSLYATLDFLLTTHQYEAALHLIPSLYPYWETYEYLSDGVKWLSKLTEPDVEPCIEPSSRSMLYLMLGNLLRHQSSYQLSQAEYQRGLKFLAHPDPQVQTSILSGLGETAFRKGCYEQAVGFYQAHLAVGQTAHDNRRIADSFNALGRLSAVQGDLVMAREYHDHGHHLCEGQGYRTGLAWWQNAMGELERARGNKGQAAAYFRESVATFELVGNMGASMLALQNLALVSLPHNPAYAEQLLNRLITFWQRGPARHAIALCFIGLSRVELAKGNSLQAARLHCAASHLLNHIGARLELGDGTDYEIALAEIQNRIGQERYQRLLNETNQLSIDGLIYLPSQSNNPSIHLTPQERMVLSLAADGLGDKQIAQQLAISPYTVNSHLKSIYRKLSANNRTSAIAAARKHKLL